MTLTTLARPLSVLLLVLLVKPVLGQGIQPYPLAITNRDFYSKTPMAAPPTNTPFNDPDLGGYMVRVTNENTNPKEIGSFFRNPAPNVNEWSMDDSKFYVVGANSANFAFAFDPATMTVSALPGAGSGGAVAIPLRAGPAFSFVDPDLMYGTMLDSPLTIASYRFSTATITPVLDTTTCNTQPALVAGPKVFSTDNDLSNDDGRIMISAGGDAFGSRPFVVVYDQQLGCRWYNTQTGQIGGQWGPSGQVNIADRFLINHSELSGNGQYVKIGVVTPGFAGFYIWDLNTLDVQPCTIHESVGLHCGSYAAIGLDTYINAAGSVDELNTLRRPLSDIADMTPLIDPLPTPHYNGEIKSFAWNNGILNSSLPVCGDTYNPTGSDDITEPFQNEVFCIETDGLASTVWRFAHNRVMWQEEYFWTQPYGNLSLDGEFFAFSSNWDDELGTYDGDGPRSDVFIVKLQ
jgi:hypothetical protein